MYLANVHLVENALTPGFLLTYAKAGDKIRTFTKIMQYLKNDSDYWKLLAEAYTSQEYSVVDTKVVWALFNSSKIQREQLMNDEERQYFVDLPETFTIYRGMSKQELESGKFRFSWSLNEDVTNDFTERNEMIYGEEAIVEEITAKKEYAIAYLNS
jgi:hypothetical protein